MRPYLSSPSPPTFASAPTRIHTESALEAPQHSTEMTILFAFFYTLPLYFYDSSSLACSSLSSYPFRSNRYRTNLSSEKAFPYMQLVSCGAFANVLALHRGAKWHAAYLVRHFLSLCTVCPCEGWDICFDFVFVFFFVKCHTFINPIAIESGDGNNLDAF